VSTIRTIKAIMERILPGNLFMLFNLNDLIKSAEKVGLETAALN
jgi:hypothetical protein